MKSLLVCVFVLALFSTMATPFCGGFRTDFVHIADGVSLLEKFRLIENPPPSFRNDNIDHWLDTLNQQLLLVNQLTAFFAWQLTVRPTDQISAQSARFNAIKSEWSAKQCQAIHRGRLAIHITSNQTLAHIDAILCRGPRFSSAQTAGLTHHLTAMQTAFVGTAVCLPRELDVCSERRFDELLKWNTFVRTLDENGVETIRPLDHLTTHYYPTANGYNCFSGESDLERIMTGDQTPFFRTLPQNSTICALPTFAATRWAWESWRSAVGDAVWRPFRQAIAVMNSGARQNGYADIGVVWREELDVGDEHLPALMASLMHQIRPLYELLHAVLRNALWSKQGRERCAHNCFPRNGSIPAHMLASMWSQNWQPYEQLLMPGRSKIAERLVRKNWTALQIVEHADDFYSSLGLPRMNDRFWATSLLGGDGGAGFCHGTAANMYRGGDVRMIFCLQNPSAPATLDDIYVAVHEMGHIQYFLGYMDGQPPVFQDGHSAMQEAIGDAMHLGFMAPQHLHRLGLVADDELLLSVDRQKSDGDFLGDIFQRASHGLQEERRSKRHRKGDNSSDEADADAANDFELRLLLRSALTKVAQIPFEYVLDVYRWDLFGGLVEEWDANAYLWRLIERHQGVEPPEGRGTRDADGLFDAGAKYHVADNTPYARYFLASFLHAQIFRGLCEVMIFGRVRPIGSLPMPLHRCDIYGSKRVGKLLRKAFEMGKSQPWTEVLYILTGYREVRADALIEYYSPLTEWLQLVVARNNMPLGWR